MEPHPIPPLLGFQCEATTRTIRNSIQIQAEGVVRIITPITQQ